MTVERTFYVAQGLYGEGPDTNDGPRPRVWKDWLRDEFPTIEAARRAMRYYNPNPKQKSWHQPTAGRVVKRTVIEETIDE